MKRRDGKKEEKYFLQLLLEGKFFSKQLIIVIFNKRKITFLSIGELTSEQKYFDN